MVVTEVKKQKDGSYSQACPVLDCNSTTFKIRRHLKDIHTELSLNQIEYAVLLAKQISRNKRKLSEQTSDTTNKLNNMRNINKQTALVSRKYDYKECLVCKKLYLNLPDHLTKTHKISRSNENYERCEHFIFCSLFSLYMNFVLKKLL